MRVAVPKSDVSARLRDLVSASGGLVARLLPLPTQPGDAAFPIMAADLGDVTQVLPGVAESTGGMSTRGQMDGAGGSVDSQHAGTLAVAEALERYASCAYSRDQFIWATARELGTDALDLDQVPRCSATELDHPACPVLAPDKDAPIRWVRGVSLTDPRPIWVPAVMTYLHIPPLSRGERFTTPISTGCAAHEVLAAALVSAICEVVERDAISVTWLQQLAIPRIELDEVPDELAAYLDVCRRDNSQHHLFDATSDVGIPTVYSVHVSPASATCRTMVMCATSLDPARAAAKVLREAASARIALEVPRAAAANWDDIATVYHGAIYMGSPERADAFRFLLDSPARRRFADLPVLETGDHEQNLALVVDRLVRLGFDAVAVDLTTDEALRAGMRVVRVVIPQLQPLSFRYRARYLGHRRLYELPTLLNLPSRPEPELNPWPQPFA